MKLFRFIYSSIHETIILSSNTDETDVEIVQSVINRYDHERIEESGSNMELVIRLNIRFETLNVLGGP